jgi:hypothetical protein
LNPEFTLWPVGNGASRYQNCCIHGGISPRIFWTRLRTYTLQNVNTCIIRMWTRLGGSAGGNTAAISRNIAVPDGFNWMTFLVPGGMH